VFFINAYKPSELTEKKYYILQGEEFPSEVYKNFWEKKEFFKNKLTQIKEKFPNGILVNVPKCLGGEIGSWVYQYYNDVKTKQDNLEEYTYRYIDNLYRKKSLRCTECKYDNECEWIHLNFIRSYGFEILQPIIR